MILYNVQFPEEAVVGEFIPQVPCVRARHEDDKVKRICLSSSISGCISAVPWGGIDFENKFLNMSKIISYPIKVYEFDTEDILEGNLIEPNELYENDLVRDALINEEHWVINQSLTPRRSYYIVVKDFVEEVYDCISYKDSVEVDRLEREGVDYDYEDYIDGCYSKIIVEEYEVLEESAVTVSSQFKIPLKSFSVDIKEQDLDTVTRSFGDFLVDDDIDVEAYLENNNLIINTSRTCSIIVNFLASYISSEIEFQNS